MPRPPWPARCGGMGNCPPWWSVSARRPSRSRRVQASGRRVSPGPGGRRARLLEADERAAKAAIHGLNQTADGPTNREDSDLPRPGPRGRPDPGRGRRICWAGPRPGSAAAGAGGETGREVRDDLRLGWLSVRPQGRWSLPAGDQAAVLATVHRDELTAAEVDGVVGLLLAAPGESQQEYILAQPRRALSRCGPRPAGPGIPGSAWPVIAWRGGWPTCWRVWAGSRIGCDVRVRAG